MIQPIMHDPLFLAQKSAPATPEDAPVARDLLETLTAHAGKQKKPNPGKGRGK